MYKGQDPDGAVGDQFGRSVSLSADGLTALIGANGDNPAAGVSAGSASVFTRDATTGAWTQQTKLTDSDGARGDIFGWSVSLSADGATALVGARLDDTAAGAGAGSASVFTRDPVTGAWTQQTQLTDPDPSLIPI